MTTRLLTASCTLPWLLAAVSHAPADDFTQLQNWFSQPEATRGAVPAQVTGTVNSDVPFGSDL